jgi:hypothetical protein
MVKIRFVGFVQTTWFVFDTSPIYIHTHTHIHIPIKEIFYELRKASIEVYLFSPKI